MTAPALALEPPSRVQPDAEHVTLRACTTSWTEVSPCTGSVSAQTNQTGRTRTFSVKNKQLFSRTFGLACSTTGAVSSCSVASTTTIGSNATKNVTVTYATGSVAGTGTLQLDVHEDDEVSASATVTTSDPPTYAVSVTPDGGTVQRAASGSYTESFTVQNTGNQTTAYSFIQFCSGTGVVNCSTPSAVTLAPGATTNVGVNYSTSAGEGTGEVRLRASANGVQDDGWRSVTVAAPSAPAAPQVAVNSVNSGTTVERDLCLTIAAGSDAAYECGDLRLVHSLPTTRTLNKARTPTLIFNSQHAHPYPVVAATVGLSSSTTPPDSVTATLTIGGAVRASGKWAGSEWVTGQTNRIALGYDGLNDNAGLYSYTLAVESWYGSTPYAAPSAAGELVVVNRAASAFGAGWWLAGLDQLHFPATGVILWVGGDGSARKYTTAGTNLWRAPAVDRPDSLTWDGTYYTRHLPHGVKVRFNPAGQHVQTVNRLAHVTSFSYDGERLTTITLPPVGSNKTYSFEYDVSNRLKRIISPSIGTTSRIDSVTVNPSNQLTAIKGPDGKTVTFDYDPGFVNRIHRRTDRRLTITEFTVDVGKRLSQARIYMTGSTASASDLITSFRAAESRGLPSSGTPSSADTARATGWVDGPRTDVGDTTWFWLDRFGAPRTIKNALGDTTVLGRTNASFPALITQLTAPNGLVTNAWHDALGLTDSTKVLNPYGDGRNALTRYTWDPKWQFATRIVPPEGDSIVIDHDPGNGNRRWQEDARGLTSRVEFRYGNGCGLLSSTQTPLSPADSLEYDGLCNLAQARTPKGFITTYQKDGVGRDTLIKVPVDPGQTKWQEERIAYDIVDRVTETRSSGPEVPYSTIYRADIAEAQTLIVRNRYDDEGNLIRLSRISSPDRNGTDSVVTQWQHDRADRMVKQIAPDGLADSLVYDGAGNQTKRISRRGAALAVTMAYDALNRVRSRTVPHVTYGKETMNFGIYSQSFPRYGLSLKIAANVDTFTYDAMGNVLRAENGDAKVWRGYYANGALKADTLKIRETLTSNFESNIYVLNAGYDLNGRRRWLKHPSAIAPSADSAAYSYNNLGLVETVRDPLGGLYRYVYDREARLDSLLFPGGAAEKTHYDEQGRVIRRIEGWATGAMRDDTLQYDPRDKITRADERAGGFTGATDNWYSGLGALTATQARDGIQGTYFIEEFQGDALGNRRRYLNYGSDWVGDSTVAVYTPSIGRLHTTRGYGNADRDTTRYDAAGNTHALFRTTWDALANGWRNTMTAYYYGADDKLRVVDWRLEYNATHPNSTSGAFEEYRYDALGRRVWLRARKDSTCSCRSYVERHVWDGAQLLYEIRGPGGDTISSAALERDTGFQYFAQAPYGRVAYTHGPGIDQPLSVIRMEYSSTFASPFAVSPHQNWRGVYDVGTFSDGRTQKCAGTGGGPPCVEIDWPARNLAVYLGPKDPSDPKSWFGSLIQQKRDASGQLYMRNRYYDPQRGRFTQEDPIGLAGGLNLYGYANGDPVNFSDPFGLCPEDETGIPCAVTYGAVGAAIGTGVGVVTAAGCTVGTGGICVAGAPAIVVGSAGLGAAIGGLAGTVVDNADAIAVEMASAKEWIKRVLLGGAIWVGGGAPDRTRIAPDPPKAEQPADPRKKKVPPGPKPKDPDDPPQ